MTIREIYEAAEKGGYLDFQVLMNCNLDIIPVAAVHVLPHYLDVDKQLDNIVILDN